MIWASRVKIILFAMLLSGAACSSSAADSEFVVEVSPSRSNWRMPLDSYRSDVAGIVRDYLAGLLVKDCMEDRGISYPPPARVTFSLQAGATWNLGQRRLFNPDIAATYGYQVSSSFEGLDTTSAEPNSAQNDALGSRSGEEALASCRSSVDEVLPALPNQSLVYSLQNAAYQSAVNEPEVLDAAERWHNCMEPAGISDLPEWPEAMPPPSLQATLNSSGASSEPNTSELQLATRDAECRESSGFAQAHYDAEWDAQVELAKANEDALTRLDAANEEFEAMLRDLYPRVESGEVVLN